MSKGLTGNIKHSSGMKWSQQKLNEYKMLRRRRVMPGYPIEKIFQTKDEIDEYLSGDKIVCLLCGKAYKSLCSHILVHGFNADTYKEKYGLPFRSGLSGESTSDLISKNSKRLVKEGIIPLRELVKQPENIKKLREAASKQRFQPFRKHVAIENVNKTKLISKKNLKKGREKGKYIYWQDSDYENILILSIHHDQHPHDIIKSNKNMVPSKSQFYERKKIDLEYRKRYYETVEKLSFKVQSEKSMLGERFINELRKLKLENKTNHEISQLFGIHQNTIDDYCAKNKLYLPRKDECNKGHFYVTGTRRCRVCNTEAKRKAYQKMKSKQKD